uniref:Shroom family member 1 n=1 Tax=Scleropages formosus TaxID=113540 RepID=A0A8C9S7W8_SCLFO
MDSFNFSLKSTSHPLKCPISRLTPAMSTSSIDQFTYDRRKGDSAYSSFSGGSSAPEYSSLYCHDDIPPHSLLFTEHWCHSVEGDSLPQEGILDRHHFSWEPPPLPPARLDSFIAIRNLENSKASQDTGDLRVETLHPRSDPVRGHRAAPFDLTAPKDHASFSDVRYKGPKHRTPAVNNSNIQQRGQYFFVTGVSKSPQANLRDSYLDSVESDAEVPRLTTGDLNSVQQWCENVHGDQQVYIQSQGLTKSNQDGENYCQNTHGSPCTSSHGCNLFNRFLQNTKAMTHCGSLRHHNSCHHIFYLGPEDESPLLDSRRKRMTSSLQNLDKTNVCSNADCGMAVSRQPLGNTDTDKINRETVQMMRRVRGESMGSLTCISKNENGAMVNNKEMRPNEVSDSRLRCDSCSSCMIQLNELPLDGIQEVGYTNMNLGSLLNDSAKKNLMGAQSNVVMDNASKKTDPQPSFPLRLVQEPKGMPSAVSFVSLSQDPTRRPENPECPRLDLQGKENFPQPQVARIGARRRLTSEQKKLCYSDPEKLHQIEDTPTYRLYGSTDSCKEDLLCKDDLSQRGLVATRRKIFETKGRALSASCLSQTSLKQLQHKAVQAYMERKMDQKPTEAQQTGVQTPSKRHSMAGKVSECNCDSVCRQVAPRKKLTRPLSASRLLDNSSRSSDYPDLSLTISSECCCCREMPRSVEKSASTENLLKQTKPQHFSQTRSASTPHAFQVYFIVHSYTRPKPSPKGHSCLLQEGPSHTRFPHSAILIALCPLQYTLRNQPDEFWTGPSLRTCPVRPRAGAVPGTVIPRNTSNRCSSRVKAAPPVQPLPVEQSVDDPEEIFGSFQEVFLNRAMPVETDSWLINLEAGKSDDRDCSPHQGNNHPEEALNLPAEPQTAHSCPQSKKETIQSRRWMKEEEEEGVSVDEPEPAASSTARTKPTCHWEDLVEAVVAEDPSLAPLLFPAGNRNTAMKLMEQLLSEDTLLMEDHYRRKEAQNSKRTLTEDSLYLVCRSGMDSLDINAFSNGACPTCEDQTKETDQIRRSDLTEKKKLLVACIEQRLQELEKQRGALREEARANRERADTIAALVQEKCLPAEFERYSQFVGDLERVVSLLLCLSARLARVENALSSVDQHTDAEEKESLDSRHRLLCKQRDDAKDLRDNLGKREQVVSSILARYLTAEQLQEYRRFVQTTASLLILQKDLDERQRLGEEQLQSLRSSLPL